VPEDKLQNKANRYYFKDSVNLDKGEIYISPFDLNVEGGVIEKPLKPMIRFTTPVFDSEGRRTGLLVFNYLGKEIIDRIKMASAGTLGQFMLLNSEGYWLKGPDPEDEWGFMYEEGKNRKFANLFPDGWKRISTADSGQFQNEDGLFTFTTVHPITGAPTTSTGVEGYKWIFVSRVPPELFNAIPNRLLRGLLSLYAVLILLLGGGSWYIASASMRRKLAEEKLRKYRNSLEEKVGLRTAELTEANKQLRREITERKKAEDRTKHHMEQLSALRSIDKAIVGSLDLSITLDIIVDQTINRLKADAADILLYKPHLETLEYAVGRGFNTQALQYTKLKIGDSHAGRAALEQRTIHTTNLKANGEGFKRSKQLAEEGFISYYGAPLIAKGGIKGVLEVFDRNLRDRDQEWVDFLETLAGQAAIALDSATLFAELQRSNINLTLSYDETIEGWSRALDLRDKETEGHSQRVTELTLRITSAMGISEAAQAHIRRGAHLHDIGKMGIPDKILLKPGPLDEEEWEIMRRHPVLAHELLFPIEYLRPALDIPYCHHEKWDGAGGYPQGLKGEQIPIAARIFAVVDIYDALCSERPYRPAWPKEKALEEIRSLAGSHLDTKVVEVFLEMDKKIAI
jgi:HD-GYP domain-containing protein (c-di-GMP phosphodiesterase class II)